MDLYVYIPGRQLTNHSIESGKSIDHPIHQPFGGSFHTIPNIIPSTSPQLGTSPSQFDSICLQHRGTSPNLSQAKLTWCKRRI